MVARPHHLMRARPWPRPGSTRTSHIELVDLAYHRGDQRRPQPCGRGVDLGEMPRSVNRSRCHTCGNKRRAAGGAGVATCGGQIGRRIFTIAWRRAAGTAGVATKRFDPILLTVRRSNEGQPAERALRQPRGRWPHWLFRLVTKYWFCVGEVLARCCKAVIHPLNYTVTLWKSISVTLLVPVNRVKEMSQSFVLG
jgi:hypothetical protein